MCLKNVGQYPIFLPNANIKLIFTIKLLIYCYIYCIFENNTYFCNIQ